MQGLHSFQFPLQVHEYESAAAKIAANEKCCGLEKISNGLSCCNYVGYSSISQVCADVSHQQRGRFSIISFSLAFNSFHASGNFHCQLSTECRS